MTPDLIQRYQPGGDIYASLLADYGRNGALLVSQAALSGDSRRVTEAIAQVRNGARLTESAAALFVKQITTDPLGAPLDAANRQLSALAGNTALAFLRNPMVLLVLAVIGFGVWINFFGFPRFLRR
jgi:hypothetical protein